MASIQCIFCVFLFSNKLGLDCSIWHLCLRALLSHAAVRIFEIMDATLDPGCRIFLLSQQRNTDQRDPRYQSVSRPRTLYSHALC